MLGLLTRSMPLPGSASLPAGDCCCCARGSRGRPSPGPASGGPLPGDAGLLAAFRPPASKGPLVGSDEPERRRACRAARRRGGCPEDLAFGLISSYPSPGGPGYDGGCAWVGDGCGQARELGPPFVAMGGYLFRWPGLWLKWPPALPGPFRGWPACCASMASCMGISEVGVRGSSPPVR